MGASGPGIFQDDLAEDVRYEYREYLRGGLTDREATDRVLVDWDESIHHPEESIVFWIALAATQARLGRLEDRVRDRALQTIDAGADLEYWEEHHPRLAPRRRAALTSLRRELLGPQRSRARIAKPRPSRASFRQGDLVRYLLDDGRSLLLRVVKIVDVPHGGTSAVYDLLLWIGTDLPDEAEVKAILRRMPPIGPGNRDRDERDFWMLHVIGPVRERLTVVGNIDWDDPEPSVLYMQSETWEAFPSLAIKQVLSFQEGGHYLKWG